MLKEKVRQLAYQSIEGITPTNMEDPMQALWSVDWEIPVDMTFTQTEMAKWNLELNQKSCFGRIAQAAAIAEKFFPQTELSYGEVWKDELCGRIKYILFEKGPEESILRELLLYEEPHAVLVVSDEQFDPISTVLNWNIKHPTIQSFPLWEGIASSWMVSKAYLNGKPQEQLAILEQAEELCPGTMLVADNKVAALTLLNKQEEALKLLKEIEEKRPTARCYYALWLLTSEKRYLEMVKLVYTPLMVEILRKEAGL